MTDLQYTPTTDDILRCYMQRGGSEEEFNRWYEAEIAAAEQRGKVEGLREAADEAGSWGPACINAALAIRRSADLLEGDDETH